MNVALTAALAAGVGAVSPPAALGVAGVGLAAVYYRGYLVPGTPTLTKRYFPDRVLRVFDHGAPRGVPEESFDVARVLLDAGAVVDTGADVAVDPAFERRWFDRVAALDRDEDARVLLADLLDVDADRLDVVSHGAGSTAYVDDDWVGQWESRAAFLADVAAARELDGDPAWTPLSLAQRSEALGGLRAVLERCPVCAGAVAFEATVVESCCRTTDVLASTCEECNARLFELEYDPAAFAADVEDDVEADAAA